MVGVGDEADLTVLLPAAQKLTPLAMAQEGGDVIAG